MSRDLQHVERARDVRRLAARLKRESRHGTHSHYLSVEDLAYVLSALRMLSQGLDGEGVLMTTLRSESGRVGPTTRLR